MLRQKGSLGDSLSLARELGEEEKLEELYAIYESLRDSGKLKVGEDVLKEIYGINPNFKDVKELLKYYNQTRKMLKGFSSNRKMRKALMKQLKFGDLGA